MQRRVASFAAVVLVVLFAWLVPRASDARSRGRRARPGFLELRSATEGAEVTVDGAMVGAVPLRDTVALKPGQHTLKLAKDGYTQYFDVITIEPGKVATVEVDLLPVAGVFVISSNVTDARVFVDGQFIGIAPLETEVLAGPRTVLVRRPGFHDAVLQRKAIAGQRTEIAAELEPMPVGSTPYRPATPATKWYERWYVWAGAAGGIAAITLAIVVPILTSGGDPLDGYPYQFQFKEP